MSNPEVNVVTGVSGYSGRHIARRLLAMGKTVVNLTGHPERPTEFGDAVRSVAFDFDDPDKLATSLSGATTLYNTYWIRFAHGGLTFDRAIANSKTLINAAARAGVRRIVHVSITNPSAGSPLPYYAGKAEVERAIVESGISHAMLRPNVLFGDQGILINNIAWFLRHLPAFAVPGDGRYKLQPVFVEDLADLAVKLGQETDSVVIDAVGPEVFEFNDLVDLLKRTVRSSALVMHLPPSLTFPATWALGKVLGDVVLTRNEVRGLLDNLLVSSGPPTCPSRLSEWLAANSDWIGTKYFSEIRKHFP